MTLILSVARMRSYGMSTPMSREHPFRSFSDSCVRRSVQLVATGSVVQRVRITRSTILTVAAASAALAIAAACGGNSRTAQQGMLVAAALPQAGASEGDFSRQVDIGGGRKLYLECRGSGSPTVILESGYHDSSQPWILADAYPPAVLPGVAGITRVCAYDRPGTLLYTDPPRITGRSSPVRMPRTARDVVDDLHALLAAARVPGPYVLVGHSMGGLFMRLYAQAYPDQVTGLVLVDAFPAELPALFGSQWPAYRQVLDSPLAQFADDPGFERIDVDASVVEIERAPRLRRIPLVVLTKGEPFALPSGPSGFDFAALERLWPIGAAGLVRLEPDAPHIVATGSDHYIQVHQPDLVIEAIRLVIERTKQRK
jgi:pimeloyl-ACP methyl ester carboxylesterase